MTTTSTSNDTTHLAWRILDANLNRLREALRVVEEYFRFSAGAPDHALLLKSCRHRAGELETLLDADLLLGARDTGTDPFNQGMVASEGERTDLHDLVTANCKRAQEAARVVEEYAKLVNGAACSEAAKQLRFSLYDLEKKIRTHD